MFQGQFPVSLFLFFFFQRKFFLAFHFFWSAREIDLLHVWPAVKPAKNSVGASKRESIKSEALAESMLFWSGQSALIQTMFCFSIQKGAKWQNWLKIVSMLAQKESEMLHILIHWIYRFLQLATSKNQTLSNSNQGHIIRLWRAFWEDWISEKEICIHWCIWRFSMFALWNSRPTL